MGSLREKLNKLFWGKQVGYKQICYKLTWCKLFSIVLLLTVLAGCVPATTGAHLEFFFSEDVWGGSPFSEAQKKQLFVEALKARDSQRISQDVPFEINDPSVTVKRFTALYEVDAKVGLPTVRSGYVLELSLGANSPARITLTNEFTGVSWAIKIKPQDE
jgi:hypothetical protein